MPNSILIDDIVYIAHCFVVLNPAPVGYFELPRFDKLLHILLHLLVDELIPIFEKYHFCDEIFSLRALLES